MLTLKIAYPGGTTIRPALAVAIDGSGINVTRSENDTPDYIHLDSFVVAYVMNDAGKTVEVIDGMFGLEDCGEAIVPEDDPRRGEVGA